MRQGLFLGFAVLVAGFGISSAAEAAMCGRSCNSGGRYFPGPPSVCADNGLNYCGSSRGGGGGGGVGVVVGPGGVGVVGPRPYGGGDNCRTVTIQRDDGSVRRIRRCD
jgi:hypothetical protein